MGLACATATAVQLSDVGGVVIHKHNEVGRYIADPAIVVLPDGSYVASHSWFGNKAQKPIMTRIYTSTDKGNTWVFLSEFPAQKQSLFYHDGALYAIGGYRAQVRRSLDGGRSWSDPVMLPGTGFDSTPCTPHVHDGRVVVANGMRLLSARLDADLLSADSWIVSNAWEPRPSGSDAWLDGKFTRWHEGQVVASPASGVVLMPNIEDLPYSALLHLTGNGEQLTFNSGTDARAGNDFVHLPGADKKFGVFYDAPSGTYFALTNPVLPQHGGYGAGLNEDLIRNAAALYSSTDLRTWQLRQIFLYSPNVHGDAFQYLQGAVDGEDLLIVARTALRDGGYTPPRGHDANMLTFHRIRDFRKTTAD